MYKLRTYQQKAVNRTLKWLDTSKKGSAGIIVAPTSFGKSLVIAEIADKSNRNTIIFQPSLEILLQNAEKLTNYGIEFGVYSASAGQKDIKKVTLATVGSVVNDLDKLEMFNLIVVDESHNIGAGKKDTAGMTKIQVEANQHLSMYNRVIKHCKVPVIGLTATPFRVHSNMLGSICKMQTRTSPKVFKDIISITQIQEVFDAGFLAPLEFEAGVYDVSKLVVNSTGANYTDASIKLYNEEVDMVEQIADTIHRLLNDRKKFLIFAASIQEAEDIKDTLWCKYKYGAKVVTGKTNKTDRKEIVDKFKNVFGILINVGTMTTGFDCPDLDCIIIGRPIISLPLYIQICGRGMRIAEGKKECLIVDLCGTYARYGNPHDFKFVYTHGEKWRIRLRNDRNYLTGVYLDDMVDYEEACWRRQHGYPDMKPNEEIITFGKHRGKVVSRLDTWYLQYGIEKFTGKWKKIFQDEHARRRLGGQF